MGGECRFVCERDPDCDPGSRCNLLTGVCVARAVDGGLPAVTFPCTTGAERCRVDASAVERCNDSGLWETTTICPASGLCLNEKCLLCRPGSTSCSLSPSEILVCDADGLTTHPLACTGGALCEEGECRACPPGSKRCSADGVSVEACEQRSDKSLQWAWEQEGDGFDGKCITRECETTGPTSARCKPPQCFPGQSRCAGTAVQEVCSDVGAWVSTPCAQVPGLGPGAVCTAGICVDECQDAVRAHSYFGCEYWSAVQDNSMDLLFKGVNFGQGTVDSEFAFVIANRSELPADLTVYRHFNASEEWVKTVTVDGRSSPSKGLAVIKVPWQSIGPASAPDGLSTTGLQRFGYRLTSNRPVTAYQFSPLDAAKITQPCASDSQCNEFSFYSPLDPTSWGTCKAPAGESQKRCHYFTNSNDASLLLPTHILGKSYVVVSTEHLGFTNNQVQAPLFHMSGHLTVVGTQDGTTVQIRSSARTTAGTGVAAMNRGDTQTFVLRSYDVLQIATSGVGVPYLECDANPFKGAPGSKVCRMDSDLTGTIVESDKPVAVFGGAACTLRPYNRAACDHLEEQIFPFDSWGKRFVAVRSHPLRLSDGTFASPQNAAPDHWKIVAGCPASLCPQGTLVTFNTPWTPSAVLSPNRCMTGSIGTNDCRLGGGQFMEFSSKADFTVTGDQPILVAQLFAGQQATVGSVPAAQGDPSLVLLPPLEQWRSSYTVLAAPGFRDNYLGLTFDDALVASVEVDGVPVTGFLPIPNTTFKIFNSPVSVGSHKIDVLPRPGLTVLPGAGVTVYGYDDFVSYGYTGGLDLAAIVTGIKPGG